MKELETALILVVEALREMNQSQRRRLLILDSQLETISKISDRLEALESGFEQLMVDFQATCRICARLNILCTDTGIKDDKQTIEEDLSDWH